MDVDKVMVCITPGAWERGTLLQWAYDQQSGFIALVLTDDGYLVDIPRDDVRYPPFRQRVERKALPSPWLQRDGTRRGSTRLEQNIRLQVLSRDRWVCQLCHLPIDPSLRHPHPRSAQVHHTVSAQGYDMRNLVAAHRDCNHDLRDRLSNLEADNADLRRQLEDAAAVEQLAALQVVQLQAELAAAEACPATEPGGHLRG